MKILIDDKGRPYTHLSTSHYSSMWEALGRYQQYIPRALERIKNAGLSIADNKIFHMELKPTSRAAIMVDRDGHEYVFFASEMTNFLRKILSGDIVIRDGYFVGTFTVAERNNKFRLIIAEED